MHCLTSNTILLGAQGTAPLL